MQVSGSMSFHCCAAAAAGGGGLGTISPTSVFLKHRPKRGFLSRATRAGSTPFQVPRSHVTTTPRLTAEEEGAGWSARGWDGRGPVGWSLEGGWTNPVNCCFSMALSVSEWWMVDNGLARDSPSLRTHRPSRRQPHRPLPKPLPLANDRRDARLPGPCCHKSSHWQMDPVASVIAPPPSAAAACRRWRHLFVRSSALLPSILQLLLTSDGVCREIIRPKCV